MSAELALVHAGQSTVNEMIRRRDMLYDFTKHVMVDGLDYGAIPGSDKKTLLKPGAEKLCTLFNFVPQFEIVNQIEDWQGERTGGEPLFYYLYRASLYRNGELVAQGDGSANSRENKYRFRWVSEEQARYIPGFENFAKRGGRITKFEPKFAIDKGETGGKYGKPAEYWQSFRDAILSGTAKPERKKMGAKEWDGFSITVDETQYRVPNPDVFDLINTLQKMAQKRALTAVVLIAANASELYTQDLDDEVPVQTHHAVADDGRPYDPGTGEVYEAPPPPPVRTEEEKADAKAEGQRKAKELGNAIKAKAKELGYMGPIEIFSRILAGLEADSNDKPLPSVLKAAYDAADEARWTAVADQAFDKWQNIPAEVPPATLDIQPTAQEVAATVSAQTIGAQWL